MKKVIGMFAALTLALGMSGFAYACWCEYLSIDGYVETGELAAEISAGESRDTEPPEKDYSWIECEVEGNELYVDVWNAYPSIDYYQEFDITNTGTIPLHVCCFDIDRGNLPDCATLEITNLESAQIHPDETAWGTIHLHLCQDTEELADYEFYVDIVLSNWNCEECEEECECL